MWNFVLKFIYFYVNMFNAFIYILPFDIHIFSGTVAEQKRYERRKRRRWKSGEKENKLFAENQNRNILISEKVEELILYLECFLLSLINYLLINGRLTWIDLHSIMLQSCFSFGIFSSQFKTWGWEIVLAPSLLSPLHHFYIVHLEYFISCIN